MFFVSIFHFFSVPVYWAVQSF